MLFMKFALFTLSIGLFAGAAAVLLEDAYAAIRRSQPPAWRWRRATRLALFAWLPLLPALGIVVVPSGMAGVRVSQISGTLAGTLYPGAHFIAPLVHRV